MQMGTAFRCSRRTSPRMHVTPGTTLTPCDGEEEQERRVGGSVAGRAASQEVQERALQGDIARVHVLHVRQLAPT